MWLVWLKRSVARITIFWQNGTLAFWPYVMTCVRRCRRRSASITNWAARISREPFDLESPNSTWTSIPTYSTTIPDMTLLVVAKKNVENVASDGFGWNFSRTIWARITNFYKLIWVNYPTNLPDITSLAASGRLQNANKYCQNAWNASGRHNRRIVRPLFNIELQNFAGTSRPTWSTAVLGMTSSADFGRHISKFEKRFRLFWVEF